MRYGSIVVVLLLGMVLPVRGQWTAASLSQARDFICSTSNGNKVFFAGGELGPSRSNVVDIYDNSTNTWSTATLSLARRSLTAVALGQKVFFAGGYTGTTSTNRVDIYDIPSNTWTTASLSIGRNSLVSARVGTKIFFAGGTEPSNQKSSVVDIYDSSTGLWTTASLSEIRDDLSAATVGTKVFFAGGNNGTTPSNVVDIYDNSTGLWSTATLSQARYDLTATALGSKVFFAGGIFGGTRSNVVDIYDNSTGLWSTATLSQSRYRLSSAAVGTKVLFAGGNAASGRSAVVDIYDIVSNTWSTSTLSLARDNLTATAGAGKIFIGGGATAAVKSDVVDIYSLLAAEPTAQPTNLIFNPVGYDNLTLNYTAASGSPAGYLIVRSLSPTPVVVPVDGVTYSGTLGSEEFFDVGNSLTLNDAGLNSGTLYYYTIYSYNGSGNSINYLTIAPLTGNQMTGTLGTFYSRQSGNFNDPNTWSNVSHTGPVGSGVPGGTGEDAIIGSGHTVTMTAGIGIVGGSEGILIEAGGTLNAAGFDINIAGNFTIAGTLLNPGSIRNNFGNLQLYNTSGNLLVIDQLIVDNFGTGDATLFTDLVVLNGIQVLSGNFNANGFGVCDASGAPPVSPVVSNKKSTSLTLSWSKISPDDAFIVMRAGPTSFGPNFGSLYNANSIFGSGDAVGTGNFVVYKGAGTSVNISGLSPNTDYEFDMYSYNTIVGGCYTLSNYQFAAITTCNSIAAPSNPLNAEYCTGDTKPAIQVNSPGSGRTIDWYDAPTGGNLVPGDGTGGDGRGGVFIPNAASGTFYAEIRDGTTSCTSDARTAVTLTMYPALVNAAASSPQSVCAGGDPTALNGGTVSGGSGTYSYTWASSTTSGGPYTLISGAVAATYDPPAGLSSTTYYQRTVMSATCQQTSAEMVVNVTPSPAITSNPLNAQACAGASTSFAIAATGTTLSYRWQADNGSGFVDVNNGGVYSGATSTMLSISNVLGLNNVRYQCVVTSGGACAVTTSAALLTVHPLPAVNNQAVTVCESSPGSAIVDLTSLNSAVTGAASGVTIGWFTNSGLTNPVSNPGSATAATGTIFYAEVRNTSTSCSSSAQAVITVSQAPVASATTPILICSATATNIVPSSSLAGTTYSWAVSTNPAITGASNGTGSSINQTLNNSATTQQSVSYSITPSVGGCIGSTITVIVNVDPIPSVFSVTGGGGFCAGTSGVAIGLNNSQPGVSYTLLNNGTTIGSAMTPGGGAFNFPLATAAGTYTVSGATGGGCQRPMSGSVPVTILNAPSGGAVTPPISSICMGETITLTAGGIANVPTAYNWTLPPGLLESSRNANAITVVAQNGSGGTITIIPANACGNGTSLSASITIHASPVVSINLPSEVWVNEAAVFSFNSSSTGSILWTFSDGQTSTDLQPEIIFSNAGSMAVDLTLRDDNGCMGSDSESFVVEEKKVGDFAIKNVVTANGDGDNDFLTIERIEEFPQSEVILMDRWGNEVFRKTGYLNDWDLKKGEHYLPAGNYVCVVRNNGEIYSRTVTVLKSN